ncbi:MAG: hypothetical protein AAF557_20425 [Pseudomonadota bacterium]
MHRTSIQMTILKSIAAIAVAVGIAGAAIDRLDDGKIDVAAPVASASVVMDIQSAAATQSAAPRRDKCVKKCKKKNG